MSSEDAPGQRGKNGRFPKGTSGNPNGRPRKPPRIIVPDQMRRDVLALANQEIEIRTENGVQKVSRQEVVLMKINQGAINGKPTCLKLWMQLYNEAVMARYHAHPSVSLTALLREIADDPSRESTPEETATLEGMIEFIKKLS